MLIQYPEKLKLEISADIQPILKKVQVGILHSNRLFRIGPHILIFLVLKNGVSFPILIANIFFMSLFFWLLENSSQQMSLQCLSTINMVFSDEDKILIRSLYLKGLTAKRLTAEFSEKCWTKYGVNKLLKTLRDTGTVYRRPEI